jgi:DNA-directed RNA polymerase specialized sigma24 family protein
MDPGTVRRLRSLLERKRRAEGARIEAGDALAVAVLAATKQGASRREIARALGVGTTTVQEWVNRGRQLDARE